MHPKNILISDYTYHLPDKKIALHPLKQRDTSKLLIYKNGGISEDVYQNIASLLPHNCLLVFNNTKVIQARILFTKSSGGVIEIFCLEPCEIINDYASIMGQTKSVKWKCMIGGVSKWKNKFIEKKVEVENNHLILKATLIEKVTDAYIVEFSWMPPGLSFAEIIEYCGNIPLPPYIKRNLEEEDKNRYQTIYAKHDGSVAAPTAGLHFTENIFNQFAKKNITQNFITLHVGAGTFKPVKASTLQQHQMHSEWIDVNIQTIKNIIDNLNNTIIAVGTTSARTLESLYWLGLKAFFNPSVATLSLSQWEVYDEPLANKNISVYQALQALIDWLIKNNLSQLFTHTQILIAPGYRFKIIKALVTNFHQPQSTLLLLVGAAIGKNWKDIYNYALENNFRFLSYGDGSLIFIDQ